MTNVFRNSNILDIFKDKIAGKSAKRSQFKIQPVKAQTSVVQTGTNSFC